MSKIRLGCSSITNEIHAGKLNKSETQWIGQPHNVTDEALRAVMQHVYQKAINNKNEYEEYAILNYNGYEIKIYAKKLRN